MQLQPSSSATNAAFSAEILQIPRGAGSAWARVIVSEPVVSWRDAVLSRLDDLVKLPRGWDGYGGEPVSFLYASYALRLLEAVCKDDAPEPQIVPGSSGDLQIEWHTPRGDVELHVRAPNDVLAWHCDSTTGPEGEEVGLINDFLVVVGWIERLAEHSGARSAAA
jgi:hypothetical protein